MHSQVVRTAYRNSQVYVDPSQMGNTTISRWQWWDRITWDLKMQLEQKIRLLCTTWPRFTPMLLQNLETGWSCKSINEVRYWSWLPFWLFINCERFSYGWDQGWLNYFITNRENQFFIDLTFWRIGFSLKLLPKDFLLLLQRGKAQIKK